MWSRALLAQGRRRSSFGVVALQSRAWTAPVSSFKWTTATATEPASTACSRSVVLQQRRFQSQDAAKQEEEEEPVEDQVVYESPLGKVVLRLRTVSLFTGVIGSGLPLIVAFKGGDLPPTGMLAIGMTFVAGSLGTTAAVYFVFSPYIYSIERIPIRQCHYENEVDDDAETETSPPTMKASSATEKKDVLLKAATKSLFMRQTDVVFDPAVDVIPYKGMRPLCNFTAKGIPLYVHPEFVYDSRLRKSMDLDAAMAKPLNQKDDPDDLF